MPLSRNNHLLLSILFAMIGATSAFGQISAQPTTNLPTGMPTETNRPVSISGEVVLEDGTPLAEPASVQRVCGNIVQGLQYTDAGGKFSFILDNDSGLGFQGASEGGGASSVGARTGNRISNTTRTQLWNCELRILLPGYTPGSASLAGRDFALPVNVGRIVLRPSNGSSTHVVSVVDLKAPEEARKEFERGREEYFKKKYDSADKHLSKATSLYPKYASALDLRGRVERALKQDGEAEKCFAQAIAADSNFVPPYLHLAALHASQGKWPEVLKLSSQAIELEPSVYADSYYFRAVAYLKLNNVADAQQNLNKVLELDREHRFPRAELMLGNILRAKGDKAGAIEHFQNYVKYEPVAADSARVELFLKEYQQESEVPKK